MLGINEIINIIINGDNLSKKECFQVLKNNTASVEVMAYLIQQFQNLKIEILDGDENNIIELMVEGELESWCWQTTETSILFLKDSDYIERGYLHFEKDKKYYHSWVCFKYKNIEYVFDPCLNLLCKKGLYTKIFKTDVRAKIFGRIVKEYFINQIQKPRGKVNTPYSDIAKTFMDRYFGSTLEKQRQYISVETSRDVNAPMYRHNTGYKATIEDGKVKTLVAHYYRNDG